MTPTNHSRRTTRWAAWGVCAVLAVALGCRDVTSPVDPGLSGRWMEYGIDTYAQLDLEKRGARVTGTYMLGGVFDSSPKYPVLGIAEGQHALLRWKEGQTAFSFEVELPSPDSDELTGKWIVDGEVVASRVTFTRSELVPPQAVAGP